MQASPAQHRSYLWHSPGQRVSVDLRLDVVDRMVVAIAEGMQTPGRGVEVGGLLLGRVRRESGEVVVYVEDFEPVECEHAAGPSFMLSATDRHVLERRLRRRKDATLRSIVGFYRSNTRREFAVTIEDVALMSSYFSENSDVLLLAHASREEPLTAGFVIWEGRTIRSHRPYLVFPFDSGALMGRAHTVDEVAPAPEPVVAREPSPPSEQSPLRVRAGWIAAGALAIAVTIGVLFEPSGKDAASPPIVARQADKAATPVRAAPEPVRPEPKADAPAAPVSPEVRERTPAAEAPDPAAPSQQAAIRPEAPPKIAQGIPPAESRASGTAERRVIEEPRRALRAFTAPAAPAIVSAAPEPRTIDPPRVDAAPRNATAVGSIADVLRTVSPERAPDPIVGATATRNPAVQVAVDTGSARSARFQPPSPVREAQPDIPADVRRRITSDVLINVRVYVDAGGRVQFAELLSNGTGANRDLASLAVFAARRWQFAPANSNGKAVPGQAVLRFHFGPEAR